MRQCGVLVLLIVLSVASPQATGEENGQSDWKLRMADANSVVQRYFQTRILKGHAKDRIIGGMSMRLGRFDDGAVLLEIDRVMRLSRGAGNESVEIREYSLESYDAEGGIKWTHSRQAEDGASSEYEAMFFATYANLTFDQAGTTRSTRVKLPPGHTNDFQVFKRLLPKFLNGDRAHSEYLTLRLDADGAAERAEMTILGKSMISHAGEQLEGYLVEMDHAGILVRAVVDKEFLPMSLALKGRLHSVWVDEPSLDFDPGATALTETIPLEGHVPTARHLAELEVTVMPGTEVPTDPPLFLDNQYQSVAVTGHAYRLILRSTRWASGTAPPSFPLDIESVDESVRRFLGPTPLSESDDPQIVSQARSLVRDAKDAVEAVTRIVHWVNRTLQSGKITPATASAVATMRAGKGDCTEYAVLTVALCRAAGIPARAVSGIEYLAGRDKQGIAAYHRWAEVWLGRWMGVDATIPEVGTSARYIFVAVEEPGMRDAASRARRHGVSMNLRMRLDAYRPEGGERVIVGR